MIRCWHVSRGMSRDLPPEAAKDSADGDFEAGRVLLGGRGRQLPWRCQVLAVESGKTSENGTKACRSGALCC